MGYPIAETRRYHGRPISANGPPHGKTTSLHRIRVSDDKSTKMRFSLQIIIKLRSLKINTIVCNTIMKFSHSDIGSTGINLGVGPPNMTPMVSIKLLNVPAIFLQFVRSDGTVTALHNALCIAHGYVFMSSCLPVPCQTLPDILWKYESWSKFMETDV